MKSNTLFSNGETARRDLLGCALLLVLAFGLAAHVEPQLEARRIANGATDDDPVAQWLGDSRQMFANSFFVKADAYFHSGYYPTIYDNNAPFKTPHIGEDSSTMQSKNSGDESTIFSDPHNWVERFELNFFPSYHTHLDEGGVDGNGASEVKEIMPWLKISAELDQHRIETYLVTAYWLRVRMHEFARLYHRRTGRHARLGGVCFGFSKTRRHLARRHRRQSRLRPTMKNFQQNLLITLALALCGLCAFQWYEQTIQREEITTLNGMEYEKNVAIQDATNSIATLNHQIAQMDARITEIKSAAATNEQLVVSQKAEIAQLQFAGANLTNEIAQYKTAVDSLQAKLKEAYDGINQQNAAITNLAAQRDDFVKKFNDEVKDRNDVVAKYNDLVNQVQKQQGGGTKQ